MDCMSTVPKHIYLSTTFAYAGAQGFYSFQYPAGLVKLTTQRNKISTIHATVSFFDTNGNYCNTDPLSHSVRITNMTPATPIFSGACSQRMDLPIAYSSPTVPVIRVYPTLPITILDTAIQTWGSFAPEQVSIMLTIIIDPIS